MSKKGCNMKVWKDVKIPASLFKQIKEFVLKNEEYNSVSDFARIASIRELARLSGDNKAGVKKEEGKE
jgi:Arc/MetJ-type ribon-helix-helix transcriptional regulator